jgi:hypothetical protein
MEAAEIRERFRNDGFVKVPGALPPAELGRLRAAAERLIESCRSGRHTTVRRSPQHDDTWGAGQLFQPTCFEPELIEAMCGDAILTVNEALIGPSRLAVVSFLFNPERARWDGPWHRDSQYMLPQEPERQLEVVIRRTWSVQWNVALVEDATLMVVPGSLERWNTPEEQAVLDGDRLRSARATGPMPGGIALRLQPGDGVAYTPLIIHRGIYRPEPRATLHFAYERREPPEGVPVHWPEMPPAALAALSPRARRSLAV